MDNQFPEGINLDFQYCFPFLCHIFLDFPLRYISNLRCLFFFVFFYDRWHIKDFDFDVSDILREFMRKENINLNSNSKISGLGENGVLAVQASGVFEGAIHTTVCFEIYRNGSQWSCSPGNHCWPGTVRDKRSDQGQWRIWRFDDLVIFNFTSEEDLLAFWNKSRELGLRCDAMRYNPNCIGPDPDYDYGYDYDYMQWMIVDSLSL